MFVGTSGAPTHVYVGLDTPPPPFSGDPTPLLTSQVPPARRLAPVTTAMASSSGARIMDLFRLLHDRLTSKGAVGGLNVFCLCVSGHDFLLGQDTVFIVYSFT